MGIPFEQIEITPDTKEHVGIMRTRWWTPWKHEKPSDLQNLFITLAGPAAEKQMRPGYPWLAFALGNARHDYEQAWKIAKQLGDDGGRFVDDMLSRTMMPFVRNRWADIVKVGDALIASEGQLLKYGDCRVILGMRPSWQEPMHPEVEAFLAAQRAGDATGT